MKAIFRSTAGMTVAEVIIALGVITVGLLALLATMPLSTSTIAESNLKTTATFLGQQRLEQIKNAQWCFSCGNAGAAVDTLGGAGANNTAVAQWADEAYDTIVVASGNTNASYPRFRRQVTVAVFFSGMTGPGTASATEESVQIVTLIAKR